MSIDTSCGLTSYAGESEAAMIKVADSGPNPRCVHLGLGWIGDQGGGLERYQDGICREHFRVGVDVTALVQSRIAIDNFWDYPVTAFASINEKRRVKLRRLRDCLQHVFEDPSTLISHHASVSDTATKLFPDVPHVTHFHGPWAREARVEGAPAWKTWLQQRQEARVYASAARVITLSQAFKDIVVRDYQVEEDRVRVVPGGIDVAASDPAISRERAREVMGWPKDRPILLSIRRLVRRVGVDLLVEAVKQLVGKHPDLLVMIGGVGPLKAELTETINRHGLQRHVKLLGFIPAELLSTSYRAADFSVVPTQSLEGFGLVTIESMAAGTPPIVTPVGSLPEVVGPLSQSLVLPGKSADQIAEGLDGILSRSVSLPSDQDCQAYVKSNYDWSVVAPRVLDVYREASGL